MGLSNEERLSGFFNSLLGWRIGLLRLRKLCEEHERREAVPKIDSWIAELDLITGTQVRNLDSSSAYWIMGAPKEGYSSLFSDPYGLSRSVAPSRWSRTPIRGSLAWWSGRSSIYDFIDYLIAPMRDLGTSRAALRIASWWDAWNWVASAFYYLDRYKDSLFAADLKARFLTLVGRVSNERYTVMVEYESELMEADSRIYTMETMVLVRHRVFDELVKRVDHKTAAGWAALSDDEDKAAREDYYDGHFDIKPVVDRVRKMTPKQMETLLAKVEDAADQRSWRYQHKENRKAGWRPDCDPLMGRRPRTEDELDKIIENPKSRKDYEAAAKELADYYGIFVPRFDVVFDEVDVEPPPSRTPKPKAAPRKGRARRERGC